jgi:hypothetical protein
VQTKEIELVFCGIKDQATNNLMKLPGRDFFFLKFRYMLGVTDNKINNGGGC